MVTATTKRPITRMHRPRFSGETLPGPKEITKTSKKADTLRIIPLGGQEEVGRNMTVFEYGQDIIILDMGIQFPEEDMPGIDYIVPNIDYLKGKEKNILAVIFSHGHLDHIGAAPILLPKLGYPPIVGRNLTLALIKRRLEDYEPKSARAITTIPIKSVDETFTFGNFKIGFFEVEHSIMDAVGVTITTPSGTIIHPGDWTMDRNPVGRQPLTYHHLANLRRPTILMLESLGSTNYSEFTVSEKEMYENLEKIVKEAEGKVIIGTFSSQIRRIGHLIEYAKEIGKKVALDGYSMRINIEIAKELGYIKVDKGTLIPISEIHKYPDNKIVIICTGAQGEGNAVLSRIISGEHKHIKINKKDTVVFSSSIIPGNERTIQRLKDELYRKCDNVIHSDIMDVHASGHCNAKSIQEMITQVRPDFFLPVYANHYFLKEAARLATQIGFPKDKIFILDNGSIIEFHNGAAQILLQKANTNYVYVDGLGIGDIGEIVLRDRQMLAQDGMAVIIVLVDAQTGQVKKSPDIISRGFVYLRESKELLKEMRNLIRKVVENSTHVGGAYSINIDYIQNNLRDAIGQFLFRKTHRRPMILPVVLEA